MLSQKLQKDLMNAYAAVHEEKRGHAAGSSDTEKQASQLASDVRYKAKGKVPDGATEEEKRKIFLQILNASPAPNVVKSMAKDKLLGEEVVNEMRYDDGKSKERLEKLAKKRKIPMSKMKDHPQFKDSVKEGKMPEAFKKYLEKKHGKKEDKKEVKEGSAYGIYKGDGEMKVGKAPRTQKGAMAYDGPNKERSEAADRIIAKTKAKRKKMKEGVKYDQNMPYVAGQTKTEKKKDTLTPEKRRMIPEKMDAVGQEDGDINNDGKKDGTDKYLASRRKAIGKAIAKKRGKVKEGFSAWRIDLDFNEQVKK